MLSERVCFDHVARHLYQPKERWEQVIPRLGDARARAWAAGCAETILDAPNPDCDRAQSSCREHVQRDHDTLLMPAYLKEIEGAEHAGQVGGLPDAKGMGRGWAFVGNRGVYVIVREVGPSHRPEVKTAYRVVPRKGHQPEDFRKAALRKLRDKTTWGK